LQVPQDFSPADAMDDLYPPGSRVILISPAASGFKPRVLSVGLHAAGGPVLSPTGDRVLFVGKTSPDASWQIYEGSLAGTPPVARTAMSQGAMGPVHLPDGRFAFSSPVPTRGQELLPPNQPELYALRIGDPEPTRLTYGLAGATDATVLGDGRILFVSGGSAYASITNQALFTINTDGTELSAYACQHDGKARIRRPRESIDGRVLFLGNELASTHPEGWIEQVLTARPFSSRAMVDGSIDWRIRAVEPAANGTLLVAAAERAEAATFGIYTLNPTTEAGARFKPVFDDPGWNEIEVAIRRPGPRPMGRLSTVDETLSVGRLLCLDANHIGASPVQEGMVARSVRFLSPSSDGTVQTLGEFPLHADGSFLVEVPANTLLGLETLDESGEVVSQLAPTFWVRPGENRSCVGCHEPHSTCPENRRPLAVMHPAFILSPAVGNLAQTTPMVTQ
jgi:hypothetical protein